MTTTRVLLTIEQRLQSELLKRSLESQPDFELVGEAHDFVDSLTLMAATQPHVWIHSWESGPELEAMLSHVHAQFPDLSIIRINPDEPVGYFHRQASSFSELMQFAVDTRPLVGGETFCP